MQFRKLSYCALFVALLFVVACGGGEKAADETAAPAPSASAPAGGGGNAYDSSKATATVSGKIMFDGVKPAPVKLPLTPECKQVHQGSEAVDQSMEVNADNTLKDVLVYVSAGAEKWTYSTPTNEVVLDQISCHYEPHVIPIMANQPLKIRNSDPFLHNIHPQPKNNPEFNMGQPVKGMESVKMFANPEIAIPVKCDVHRWMQAYITVMKNPFYAVTGTDGSFSIKLPAGSYTIEAWHEKLGTQTQQVTVVDNEAKEATFTFKAM